MLLRESVLDLGLYHVRKRTLGFCPRHNAGLCAVASHTGMLPGVAILFGDVAREAAHRIRAGKPVVVWRHCVECQRENMAETTYARELVRQMADAGWAEQWGPALRLCAKHSASVLGHDPTASAWLTGHSFALGDGPEEPDSTATPPNNLGLLQAALLGSQLSREVPAQPRWGCGYCDAEAEATLFEARRLLQTKGALPGCLCRRHAGLVMKNGVGGNEDLLRHYTQAAGETRAMLEAVQATSRPRGQKGRITPLPCPLCTFVASGNDTFVKDQSHDDPADLDGPLCLRHTGPVLDGKTKSAGKRGVAPLRAQQAQRLESLAGELDELFRKSAWSARHEPKGSEQTSWISAAHCLGYDD